MGCTKQSPSYSSATRVTCLSDSYNMWKESVFFDSGATNKQISSSSVFTTFAAIRSFVLPWLQPYTWPRGTSARKACSNPMNRCVMREMCASPRNLLFSSRIDYICVLNRPITITSINGWTTSGTLLWCRPPNSTSRWTHYLLLVSLFLFWDYLCQTIIYQFIVKRKAKCIKRERQRDGNATRVLTQFIH